ncbi:uncharacterized protein STEHIDRAFT_106788 [Stereum hirsutum FP-91666 SS1]|uniref:uncharacterized protein n=1 Tax=Stereum hirsutum (strain FP-91666) TaxID=721885 RepID=UPI000440AC8F|nr:uncharacterized protein STEHIDRAFT_106788 [Stereum hirsutum FP-91666 SS1]EIM92196.1 hypothetical protein STEHIDRAFT_106788 [Stereum hirsutum FP-91666 SS1]
MHPQNFHGLPARPNLPPNPITNAVHNPNPNPTPVVTTRTQTQAVPVPNLFANPYAQQPSPHYAQAYAQYYNNQNPAQNNAQGYAYSAAYNPSASSSFQNQNQNQNQAVAGPSSGYGHNAFRNNVGSGAGRGARGTGQQHHHQQQRPQHQQQQQTNWFSPGGARCKHPGCMFAGSAKAVEIHMMDRHLIYPPGWDKKKRRDEWDADPSLKGKPVFIQGTSINLNDPENLEKWIEERKKRWPTAARVDEKKRKLDEAIARGQLHPDDPALRGQKRRRVEGESGDGGERGGFRGGTSDGGCTIGAAKVPRHEDAAITPARKPAPPQPKKPPRNPFGTHPSLLRNLLLPEIRMTVSNLSQAIHFLVTNDFLENVELKPGQAEEKMIEVVDEQKDDSKQRESLVPEESSGDGLNAVPLV